MRLIDPINDPHEFCLVYDKFRDLMDTRYSDWNLEELASHVKLLFNLSPLLIKMEEGRLDIAYVKDVTKLPITDLVLEKDHSMGYIFDHDLEYVIKFILRDPSY